MEEAAVHSGKTKHLTLLLRGRLRLGLGCPLVGQHGHGRDVIVLLLAVVLLVLPVLIGGLVGHVVERPVTEE